MPRLKMYIKENSLNEMVKICLTNMLKVEERNSALLLLFSGTSITTKNFPTVPVERELLDKGVSAGPPVHEQGALRVLQAVG